MTTDSRVRFDVAALRARAGDTVFERGEAYHHDGLVEVLLVGPDRAAARVSGTRPYRTLVTQQGRTIGGHCSCPGHGDWGFCKHMVATALAANATEGEASPAGATARIREHLKAKGADALVEMILELAQADAALFRRLDLASAALKADDETLEARLRRSIDQAARVDVYVDRDGAADWARGIDDALDAVADTAAAGRGRIALAMADLVMQRIEQTYHNIEDDEGLCSGLMERAQEIHLAAVLAVRPEDPRPLARDLFQRELHGDLGTFAGAAQMYAEALGDAGLAEYRRLAQDAWDALPPRSGTGREPPDNTRVPRRLQSILDAFAERAGDVECRIALRTKDLSSPWRYLALAEFCLAQGREDEALRRAEEGLWLFEESRSDERLVLFTARLLEKAGRGRDAEAHLRRAFAAAPSLELYAPLREIGGESARDWAIGQLGKLLAGQARARMLDVADFLIDLLIREEFFDAAWSAYRAHGASIHASEALARASEATHPREAVAVYIQQVDTLVERGGNSSYDQAARTIGRIRALQDPATHRAYVAGLKQRFTRKRNFMKLLG